LGEFTGETFAVVGQCIEEALNIRRRGFDEDVHIFGEADVAVQGDSHAAHDHEPHATFSEDDQQFFERGFHRLQGAANFRRGASGRFFEGLPSEPTEAGRRECRQPVVLQVHEDHVSWAKVRM